MKQIKIDWKEVASEDDFYDYFLPQVEAPSWHGRNLDALNDSLINGNINGIEPPYCIININSNSSNKFVVEFRRKVFSIFVDAVIESKGIEIILK